ncbi:hypothetical protein Purlil1_3280 [Purpureocillium lilacinum]|uniref:Uncharacterized protein n=1 Tax=Purpureocillium lilacinum TaxID=33203 RepID=A0ABR0C8R5_PURLI|nr:hypothetical protein Purlil1_3280 [Purpureocillium lilacinum]
MCAFAEAQSRRRRVDRPTGRPGSLLDTHAGSHDAGAQEVANHGEAAVNVPTAPQPVPASGEELVCLWRAVVKDRAGMESHKPRRSSVPSRSPATAPSPQLTVSLHAYLVTRFIARCIRCLSRVADAPVFTMVEHAGAWLGQPYVVGRYRTQSVLASRRDERPSCQAASCTSSPDVSKPIWTTQLMHVDTYRGKARLRKRMHLGGVHVRMRWLPVSQRNSDVDRPRIWAAVQSRALARTALHNATASGTPHSDSTSLTFSWRRQILDTVGSDKMQLCVFEGRQPRSHSFGEPSLALLCPRRP